MAEDVSLISGASNSACEMYTKEIRFSYGTGSTVDVSALTADEKKCLLQCLEKDATTVDDTVENFISTHDEHHLKDVGVEDMRRIIPKFFMYCDDRDLKSCKKVKGLWDKRPDWWDAHVPFFDPNNRKRLKHEAGMPAKKPTKDELVLMLEYLFRLCKEKRCRNAATPPASSAYVPLPSPTSCQSALSCDSWATSSTVLSSLSVQTLDDMETDGDCGPSPTAGGIERCLSSRHCDSPSSVLRDTHTSTSSNAAINLDSAYQQINVLPQSEDKQLMMDVYELLKKQNEIELTAEQLTQLKQHIRVLMDAASFYRMCESYRSTLVNIKAKYGRHSSSATTSGSCRTNVVKTERVDGNQHFVSAEQRQSVSDNVDGNSAFGFFTAELDDLYLTDVMEVITCDAAESCGASTSSAARLPNCELSQNISDAYVSTDLVASKAEVNRVHVSTVRVCSSAASSTCHSNSENTAGKLLGVESRYANRSNALSTAFSADQRLHSQPKKPT